MRRWPVQDAEARLSELLGVCVAEGPQVVTIRGVDTAVLVAAADWSRLQAVGGSTLKQLLLQKEPRFEITIPKRGVVRYRPHSSSP